MTCLVLLKTIFAKILEICFQTPHICSELGTKLYGSTGLQIDSIIIIQ